MVVGVHVRVVGAGVVFNPILDELETRNAHLVEGEVVGTARITGRKGCGA